MLRKLKHHKIDKARWDEVITGSDNPHVYLLSWYLDVVSPGWQALVYDDYRFVMPLPVKYRYGVPYLVQPLFCQRIDISGIGVSRSIARKFYRRLFWTYPYYHLQIDNFVGLEKRKYLNGRINYTLDLTPSYDVLTKDYHENAARNIRKAAKANVGIKECNENDFLTFGEFWATGVTPAQLGILGTLMHAARQYGAAWIVRATDSAETHAAASFLVWNSRIVYLAGASSPRGRELSAMFLIFDHVIMKYSQSGYLLDFEGSMLPGVAKFFRGFGAKSSYYYELTKYFTFYR